ncbi:MAG: hypothetical protein LQ350_002188 [Teloschistes chrysophthalmus]|nr:MAG: hypothetical protein LQ350_002188 [Niorma chrysophthalma]
MAATEPEKKWYYGNCHCAAVKFKVHFPSLDEHEVTVCNCSICTRNGYTLVYPKREDIEYLRGEDTLKAYYFGSKKAEHRFCPVCGSSVSIDPHGAFGTDFVAMNVRMFQDVELDKLKVKTVNGKETLGEPYNPE